MAIDISGKLEKLKIQVYEDVKRKQSVGPPFAVMFNPTSITIQHQNVYKQRPGLGNSSQRAGYTYTRSQAIQLELIIDGTGVTNIGLNNIPGGVRSVPEQVKEFLDLCFYRDGKIHEPKYLRLSWGKGPLENFDSRLVSVDIEYTTFEQNGTPLRAVLKTNFTEDLDQEKRTAKERSSSPDLTHSRIIKSGDTLPLLCKEIYGKADYYLRVAQANNLNNFRNLTPGQEIIFPPLEK